eukprot:3985315-Pyramimonas_sp.AAC.1
MQLRVNTSHPPNESLARAIRIAGGSQRSVEMALNLHCVACAAHGDLYRTCLGELDSIGISMTRSVTMLETNWFS